jgi:hypothetical protein
MVILCVLLFKFFFLQIFKQKATKETKELRAGLLLFTFGSNAEELKR